MTAAYRTVPISEIEIADREFPLDQANVERLAASIAEIGLQTPITVRPQLRGAAKYRLVIGAHRLMATAQLGLFEIEARVVSMTDAQAKLAEIEENLVRQDVKSFHFMKALKRIKAIYEEAHPETKAGAAGAGARWMQTTNLSFAQYLGNKLGLTERSVQRQLEIADAFPDDVAARLFNPTHPHLIKLARTHSALKLLSKQGPEMQSRVLDELEGWLCRTVPHALAKLAPAEKPAKRPKSLSAEARRMFLEVWDKSSGEDKKWIAERVISAGLASPVTERDLSDPHWRDREAVLAFKRATPANREGAA